MSTWNGKELTMTKEMTSSNTARSAQKAQKKEKGSSSVQEFETFTKANLRSISEELYLAAKSLPSQDASYTFPYSAVEEAIKKAFSIEKISIQPGYEALWIEKEEAQKRCQDGRYDLFAMTLSGISEWAPIYIQFPISAYSTLFSTLLGAQNAALALEDPLFFEQFRSFFLFQICATLKTVPELVTFAPSLEKVFSSDEKNELAPPPLFLTTASCTFQEQPLSEIFIYTSAQFFDEWKVLYAEEKNRGKNLATFRKTLRIPISVELGRTFIQQKELVNLQEGDFFLVEHPFYKPSSDATRAVLTVRGKPLFKAKIKAGRMKILEMPIQHEIFYSVGDAILQPEEPTATIITHQEDDSFDTMKEEEVMTSSNAKDEEKLFSDDEMDLDSNPFEGEDTLDEEGSRSDSQEDTEILEESKSYLPPEKIDVTTIPHTVVVQLTQINMTTEELSNLRSGSIIDLDVQTEDLVSLVIRDRVIALGKLIMIGDHIGVHIQEVHTTIDNE